MIVPLYEVLHISLHSLIYFAPLFVHVLFVFKFLVSILSLCLKRFSKICWLLKKWNEKLKSKEHTLRNYSHSIVLQVPWGIFAHLTTNVHIHLCACTLKEVMEWNDSVKSCTDLTLPLHGSWKAPVMYQESAEALIRTRVNHCSGNPEQTEAAWGEVSRASGRCHHRRLAAPHWENVELVCACCCCCCREC